MRHHVTPLFRYSFAFLLTLLLTSCFSSSRTIAVEEGWEIIGETKVNFVRDEDELDVKSYNRFTAIRFRVEDREVRLNELEVVYDNGDILKPQLDETIPADRYSRDIELSNEGRVIDKIRFKYRTTGNVLKGRANVLVFGRKAETYR